MAGASPFAGQLLLHERLCPQGPRIRPVWRRRLGRRQLVSHPAASLTPRHRPWPRNVGLAIRSSCLWCRTSRFRAGCRSPPPAVSGRVAQVHDERREIVGRPSGGCRVARRVGLVAQRPRAPVVELDDQVADAIGNLPARGDGWRRRGGLLGASCGRHRGAQRERLRGRDSLSLDTPRPRATWASAWRTSRRRVSSGRGPSSRSPSTRPTGSAPSTCRPGSQGPRVAGGGQGEATD
jgi:hypothetical protein